MARIPDPHRDVRWAWGFVVLIVAGGILAQFIGYGIAVAAGIRRARERRRPPLGRGARHQHPAHARGGGPGAAALIVRRPGRSRRPVLGYVAAAIGALTVVYWLVVTVAA